MEVDTNHPAREEWQKQKDFVETTFSIIYVTLLVRIKKKSAKHQVRQPHIV